MAKSLLCFHVLAASLKSEAPSLCCLCIRVQHVACELPVSRGLDSLGPLLLLASAGCHCCVRGLGRIRLFAVGRASLSSASRAWHGRISLWTRHLCGNLAASRTKWLASRSDLLRVELMRFSRPDITSRSLASNGALHLTAKHADGLETWLRWSISPPLFARATLSVSWA